MGWDKNILGSDYPGSTTLALDNLLHDVMRADNRLSIGRTQGITLLAKCKGLANRLWRMASCWR